MGELVRREEGLKDDIIHHLPVARLMTQHGQSIVDPIQQHPGLLDTKHTVLQLCVAHGDLRVHNAEQRIQIAQRPVQLLRDLLRKAFQSPDNVPIMLEHHLGIVIHIAAQLLLRLPRLWVDNRRILYKTSAFQKGKDLFRLRGRVPCGLLTRAGFH